MLSLQGVVNSSFSRSVVDNLPSFLTLRQALLKKAGLSTQEGVIIKMFIRSSVEKRKIIKKKTFLDLANFVNCLFQLDEILIQVGPAW